jgi:hypothetical protein
MEAWGAWFEAIAHRSVDQGGFSGGREISRASSHELPWGADAMTGYNIIKAESLDEAERVARECPFVTSVRVYELRST